MLLPLCRCLYAAVSMLLSLCCYLSVNISTLNLSAAISLLLPYAAATSLLLSLCCYIYAAISTMSSLCCYLSAAAVSLLLPLCRYLSAATSMLYTTCMGSAVMNIFCIFQNRHFRDLVARGRNEYPFLSTSFTTKRDVEEKESMSLLQSEDRQN